uniref:Myocyte enhancer factor 2ab n=1 Tax=Sinocyclocheilus anshuiensis TaxID=1608454 RepID=A0A671PLB9_9TELE
ASYVLTPHTEEKYQKINEEFDNMMRNHKLVSSVMKTFFSLFFPTSLVNTFTTTLATTVQYPPTVGSNTVKTAKTRPSNGFVGGSEGNSMGRVVSAKSQASSTSGRKPDLRVLIPPVCKGTASSLVRVSFSSQSLNTPVVSVATPSLHPQGLVYSAMTSSFTTDFALSSTEPSSLHSFSSPDAVTSGAGSSWKHSHHGQPGFSAQRTTQPQIQASGSISIKSEPISPPRERVGHSLYPTIHTRPRPSSGKEVGRSPAESFSSSGSSYEGSDREDQRLDSHPGTTTSGQRSSPETESQEDPSVKRMRTD